MNFKILVIIKAHLLYYVEFKIEYKQENSLYVSLI